MIPRTRSGSLPDPLALIVRHVCRLDRIQWIVSVVIFLWVGWFSQYNSSKAGSIENDSLAIRMPYATLTSKLVIEQTLSNDVLLKLVLLENTEKAGTTLVGDQHWAHVTVPPSSCIPTFSMRLVGDALLPIVLQLQQLQRGKKAKRAPQVWLGQFEIPRTGDYRLEFAWLGCPGEDGAAKHVSTLQESIHLVATVCLLYTSPSPRDRTRSRMPSSA